MRSAALDPGTHVGNGTALGITAFSLQSVDLYVTSACNRRCAYCFHTDLFLSSRKMMDLQMVALILNWCGAETQEVTLLGGEPSLHPEITTIAQMASQAGLSARIVTNGSHAFRSLLERSEFRSSIGSVAISLDHTSELEATSLRGGHALQDALISSRELRRLEIPFTINCTVTSRLVEELQPMIDFVEGLGASRLNLHWLSSVGRARKRLDLAIDAHEWRKVLETVSAYRSPRSDFTVDCETAWRFDESREFRVDTDCAVRAGTNLQFFPDGRVFACGLIVESDKLHAYEWRDGAVHARWNTGSELDVVASGADCPACPIRTLLPDYRDAGAGGLRPTCIYERTHSR